MQNGRYSFADVARVLADIHGIADGKQSAFAGRLKHLQRLGFPPGINTGRGVAATYHSQHLFLLGLALEMNQLGLNPERTRDVILENMSDIAVATRLVCKGPSPLAVRDDPIVLAMDPGAMSDLTDNSGGDIASISFHYFGMEGLGEEVQAWFRRGLSRISVLGISTLIYEISVRLDRIEGGASQYFFDGLKRWTFTETAKKLEGA